MAMPRTKLADAISNPHRTDPPVDWVSALLMERMKTLGYNYKTLANAAHIGYDTMRRCNGIPICDWPNDARDGVCSVLGLDVEIVSSASLKARSVRIKPVFTDCWFEVKI